MYYLKNKILYILIIFILSLLLVGCNKKEYKTNIITEEEIYLQEDIEYYVYFYKEGCKYCEDVFDVINEYISNPYDLPLYVCKIDADSIVNRKYSGEGQGTSGTYYVDNMVVYTDLYISGAPSLIKINEKNVSSFVTSGRKSILQYFEELKQINEDME